MFTDDKEEDRIYEKGKDAMCGAGGIGCALLCIMFWSFNGMVGRDGCRSRNELQCCGDFEG
jgi:hypothetical protein